MHSPGVRRSFAWALVIGALALTACSSERVAPRVPFAKTARPVPSADRAPETPAGSSTAAVEEPPHEHWYFESLSPDGKRALLRELDPEARSVFHIRVVDVDGKQTLEDITLPELAKIPASTIGGKPTELAALEWMLASPAFGRDVVRGARVAGAFPFGECGRLAAATNGSAIAFDAGDWLYVADEAGRVRRRLVEEAAYDPRFTPDGKYLFFRRATGAVDVFAKYELFVVPTDLSAPPRALPSTAGTRDRFVMHPAQNEAYAITSQPRGHGTPDTCVVSLSLKPPFAVKKLACLDDGEQLVDSVVSPKGRWAALSTKKRVATSSSGSGSREARGTKPLIGTATRLEWRLRVVSLATGKVVRDEAEAPGLHIRAISDRGLLVQSGALGTVVTDVPGDERHPLAGPAVDLGYRGFFRNERELVYVAGASVGVVDVSKTSTN